MSNKILIVVDMQNDFITGDLGTPEARAIVPRVVEKVKKAQAAGIPVYYTMDTHFDNYLDTQEGRKLPFPHCLRGSDGWQIISELREIDPVTLRFEYSERVVTKYSFGYGGWDFDLPASLDEIELVGVCTDICVVSNALILRSYEREAEITVDASCCAGTTPENHQAALRIMKCCQINVIGE